MQKACGSLAQQIRGKRAFPRSLACAGATRAQARRKICPTHVHPPIQSLSPLSLTTKNQEPANQTSLSRMHRAWPTVAWLPHAMRARFTREVNQSDPYSRGHPVPSRPSMARSDGLMGAGPTHCAALGPSAPSIQTSRWPPVERRSESRSSATPPPDTDPAYPAAAARARSPRRCLSFLISTSKMSRGGSAGGGQSQLGYLFGSGEAPKPAVAPAAPVTSAPPAEKPAPAKPDVTKQIPAGVTSQTNNYHRADGQNTGNFLTDRPSTKVHAAPGGGSSLDYLFGGK